MSDENRIDEVVDDLLPTELDWRRLVRAYPIPSLAVAAAGGFMLGKRHGKFLLSAAVAYASSQVNRNIRSLVEAGLGGGASSDAPD